LMPSNFISSRHCWINCSCWYNSLPWALSGGRKLWLPTSG
jgi:hypothetical protein